MTMHLVGPYMTTTNYKKRKQKKLTPAQHEKLSTKDLLKYATTVDAVEEATGINFFPKMGEKGENTFDLKKWPEIK